MEWVLSGAGVLLIILGTALLILSMSHSIPYQDTELIRMTLFRLVAF